MLVFILFIIKYYFLFRSAYNLIYQLIHLEHYMGRFVFKHISHGLRPPHSNYVLIVQT